MDDTITTKSVAKGFANIVEDFVLYEKDMSRIVFQAQAHTGGVRGTILRQRRENKQDIWISDQAIPIRQLEKNEFLNIEISTAGVSKLYNAIQKVSDLVKEHGIPYGQNEYKVVDPRNVIITDDNKSIYIKKIIDAGFAEDVWKNLAHTFPEFATKLAYAKIKQDKQKAVEEFKYRLNSLQLFHETSGSDSWQRWIYQHSWLFGVNYKKPFSQQRINPKGIMPDYLFPTLDNFTDILEIKLPTDQVIFSKDSHPGSWFWTPATNTAIGQVVNYLSEIERNRLNLQETFSREYNDRICLLKPRAYILIGNSKDWDDVKKEGLKKMNHALHGIEILTYYDLLLRGENIIANY